MPEPLWWLLGAIVSFYFGARELHYRREAPAAPQAAVRRRLAAEPESASAPVPPLPAAARPTAADPNFNAALEEWRRLRA